MNLSQLEVFAAISETGSFTAAAERVGITRSAASHALANLEAELGVTLLDRERGGTNPTTVGHCILQNVREILANIESIQQEAANVRGLKVGKLRIGIVSSISISVWGGLLRKFRQENPGIELVTFEGGGHEVEDWLRKNIVDVGFVLRQSDEIDSVMLGHDEVQVLIPATHPMRKLTSVTLEHLVHEPFILPKVACDFMDANWHSSRHVELQQRYEATEVQTILAMVREGMGISMLPTMLLPNQLEGLHLLSLDPPLCFTFGVGVRSLHNASPAAKMFMQAAQVWANANGIPTQPQSA